MFGRLGAYYVLAGAFGAVDLGGLFCCLLLCVAAAVAAAAVSLVVGKRFSGALVGWLVEAGGCVLLYY